MVIGDLSSFAMQVEGSGGRSPPGKQGGLGVPQPPPTAGPPSNGGGITFKRDLLQTGGIPFIRFFF